MWGLLLYLLELIHLSPIPLLADTLGTTTAALNLVISILMGYPISIIYHKYIIKYEKYRHLYFIITGLEIAFFNFGLSCYHSMVPVLAMHISNHILKPGTSHIIFNFTLNMIYLLVGYIMTESEDYDITWTMPQCVLALKMISLSFDLSDGFTSTQLHGTKYDKTFVTVIPSFQELMAFTYFPGCFLIGPLISFRRYSDFINNKFPLRTHLPVYKIEAWRKLVLGTIYLIAHQIGVNYYNMEYMQSDEFDKCSFLYRHWYCGLWAHFALYKYIACWLLSEASCVRIGLSYTHTIKLDGDYSERILHSWDGCNNIKIYVFETATKFQHYIDSFNCNTNRFASEYIYKRLKFLGNKNLSQFLTLLFLAVWHGTYSGYFVTFFNEFLVIMMEKDLEVIFKNTKYYDKLWSNTYTKCLLYALLKFYTIIFMGWSLVPFDLKSFTKWWPIYQKLNYSGLIFFLPWKLIYKPVLLNLIDISNLWHPDAQ